MYKELLWIFTQLPDDYVVLDTETTGLPDENGLPDIATGVYVTLCSLNRGWTTFGSRLASEIREASYSEQPHLYFAAANPINAKGRLQMILLYQSNKATFR